MVAFPHLDDAPDTNAIVRESKHGSAAWATAGLNPYLTLLLFLVSVMVLAALRGYGSADTSTPLVTPLASVDPNVAPWWELTVLPRIGEHTARAIVGYRKSAGLSASSGKGGQVFQEPADLARVHGIGPRTVQRIAPYLRFDGGPNRDS